MRLLLLLLVLSVVVSATFVDLKSGQIVVKPKAKQNSQLFLKGSVFENNDIKNIYDTQVSNLVSNVMGLLPLNSENAEFELPNVSVFNKPKLNLFFSVESVSKDDLVNSKILNSESMINIKSNYFTQDTVSELNTIVTGVSPSSHGIPSSSWLNPTGKKTNAFESNKSNAPNLAYLVNSSFNGKSLIISQSASKKLASSTGVNVDISNGIYEQSDIYTYSLRPTGSFLPINHVRKNNKLSLSNKEIETFLYTKEFQQFILPSGWKASMNSGIFSVSDSNGNIVKIDYDTFESSVILSELAAVFNTVKMIKSDAHFKQLALDSVPDFISFDFSSIASIRQKDGASSTLFKFALAMIEQTIESTYTQLSGIYGERVACEIVTLAPTSQLSQNQIDAIEEIVGEKTYDIEETLPHIYLLPKFGDKAAEVCEQLKASLKDLSVQCNTHSALPIHMLETEIEDDTPVIPTNNNGTMTQTQITNKIAAFQILLFFPIVMTIFVVGGILLIMVISSDAQKDTLLYRSTERRY
ncbi:hypothetical protein DICPUDRAFT_51759 [Dictyostelium purpureum]|uniref:Uncharacterized protein n=1 Tax=Dictyostelium purpureum TaxID=5786 RepID=F1A596_DICPU|nr:uncharacterized protein DICPUDRAFT_51759 [Dictyostelium purpureum]EGC28636.1 hypothetical protein DICPUDRAFT_51759 [Dictyostelium purpureum]|eukprot:XP_003294841.1 hypothetical protein DICPUDRAFT_51759 [Dictyostelium purpureum]